MFKPIFPLLRKVEQNNPNRIINNPNRIINNPNRMFGSTFISEAEKVEKGGQLYISSKLSIK